MPAEFRLDRSNDASTWLDLLRFVAAQVVCIGHALSLFQVTPLIPPHIPYFQNVAVIVFFMLSGVVISIMLLSKSRSPNYTLSSYAIDRIARIHTVLLTAIVFVAFVDGVQLALGTYPFPQYFTWGDALGTALMLNMYRGPLNWAANNFATMGPAWSLAVEFHIYLFVGGIWFCLLGRRPWFALLVAFCAAPLPLIYLYGDVQPGLGTGLFAVWLLGFGLGLLMVRTVPGVPTSVLIVTAAIALYLYSLGVTPGAEYRTRTYPSLFVAFACVTLLACRTRFTVALPTFQSAVHWAAGYSLTLFATHYTVVSAIQHHVGSLEAMSSSRRFLLALASFVVSNAVAIPLAHVTERRYKRVAAWLKGRLTDSAGFATSVLGRARRSRMSVGQLDKNSPTAATDL